MFKKVLKCLFVLILAAAAVGGILWALTEEVPVLNRTIKSGEVITAEDIEFKYHISPGSEYVLAERDLIGKTVISGGEIPAKEIVAKILLVSPETTVADEKITDYILVPVTLTDGQFPLDLEEGDKVYVSTFYSSGAVAQESSFNIVYPTVAVVNEFRTSSPTEGTVIATKGVDLLVEPDYAAAVLYGTIAGQTYLLRTDDVDAKMLDGHSAEKQFREYYNLPNERYGE